MNTATTDRNVTIQDAVRICQQVAEMAARGHETFEAVIEDWCKAGFDAEQVIETVEAVDINL